MPPDAVPQALRRWLARPDDTAGGLGLEEVRWLRERMGADGSCEPLKVLLEGGRMELPSPTETTRNPELEVSELFISVRYVAGTDGSADPMSVM